MTTKAKPTEEKKDRPVSVGEINHRITKSAKKPTKPDGRKNNGRKKGEDNGVRGYRAPQTLERMVAKRRLVERIVKNTDKIFNAQLNKGLGETFLMVKITERGPKGGVQRVYHEIVRDPQTIIDYLDGELPGGKSISDQDHFYYMSTKEADNNALLNMLDRGYGRPTEKVELGGADDGDLSELSDKELDERINEYIINRTKRRGA